MAKAEVDLTVVTGKRDNNRGKEIFGINDPGPVPDEPQPELHFTDEQLAIQREGKRMIGGVLTILEAAIPPGRQLDSTKKLIQNKMYDGLKAILGELK